ncbi:MAG: hypothetical protein ACFE9Z_10965 [Promethearchaeota archaeon]
MQKQEKPKKHFIKVEVSGSETVLDKIKRKTPWIFGNKIRKPKILFPKLRKNKLKLPTPPKSLGLIFIFTILFILQTGIVYLIVREPLALGADSESNPVFVWLYTVYEAYIIESIVASILLCIASFGFLLVHHASKYVYNKKLADKILLIGIIMIIIAFTLLQLILHEKTKKPDQF